MTISIKAKDVIVQKLHEYATNLIAKNLIAQAEIILADPLKDQKGTEDKFFIDEKKGNRFVKMEDVAKEVNKIHDGTEKVDHSIKWSMSLFKALKPVIEKFVDFVIKKDSYLQKGKGSVQFNRRQLDQVTRMATTVLNIVDLLDKAGANMEEIEDILSNLEGDLKIPKSGILNTLKQKFAK